MKKADILQQVISIREKLQFYKPITDKELDKAQLAIKALVWEGWDEAKAAEMIIKDFAFGSDIRYWFPKEIVSEMRKASRQNKMGRT